MSAAGQLRRLTTKNVLSVIALLLLPFVVYSNNYRHAFVLDDAYTIVSNTSVRSLGAIPSYFVDPSTYTSIREQAEYRPILQTTYALNYALGGYDTWWWHFTQILLHGLVSVGIFALTRRILLLLGDARPEGIALIAATIFAIHPAAAGVVNYLNARSSLLTAAFLLPALLAYMRTADTPRYSRPQWIAAALYSLALFTKVEAVGVLGAFLAFELWQRARETPGASLAGAVRSCLDRRTWTRLAPALAITAVYFVIRARLMAPYPLADARHAPDVGAYEYLLTQLTAWWYYVYRVIAPVQLIADYQSYPVYRTWREPVVLLAAGGWLAVAAILGAWWKRAPYLLFLAVAALAVLSPTSSIAPLAEMVNEHRPYLPMGILSLAVIIPAGIGLRAWPTGAARAMLATASALLILSLGAMTYHRNESFATSKRYWADVLSKAPGPRARMNYGLALMGENDLPGALREFQRSLDLAPSWYFTHINLGIAYQHLNQRDSAHAAFDRAVTLDRFSGLALTWRGEFRLADGDFAGARDDFTQSAPLGLQRYRNAKGLATAAAGLGQVDQALAETDRMLVLDSAAAVVDVAAIASPFFGNPALRPVGVRFFQALDRRLPGRPWIAENIARLNGLANGQEAVSLSGPQGRETSIDPAAAIMSRGLAALRAGDPAAAAARFRELLAINPAHYGAQYQLAVALDRLGRAADARPLWERVLVMARGYGDQATIQTARDRLARRP